MIKWNDVQKKLIKEYNGEKEFVAWAMKKMQKNVFPEIEQNIEEWALDKPFTEIMVGEWCVPLIMDIYPHVPFVYVVQCLKEYKDSGYKDINITMFDKK